MSRPKTVAEWSAYISTLAGETLFSQATAANSQSFASMLRGEGLDMGAVEEIMLLFVRQCRRTGVKVPHGGPWDLVTMALTDPEARDAVPMDEMEAALLESSFKPGADDFDMFELEAEFE